MLDGGVVSLLKGNLGILLGISSPLNQEAPWCLKNVLDYIFLHIFSLFNFERLHLGVWPGGYACMWGSEVSIKGSRRTLVRNYGISGQKGWKNSMSWGGVVVVQLLSLVQLFVTRWIAARQASLCFTVSWSLLKLMSTESVMPSNHLILFPLLLLISIFPSISHGMNWPHQGSP